MIPNDHNKPYKFNCKNCEYKSCAIAELIDVELELLSENITQTTFDARECLFRQGTRNSHILYIKEGLVKVHMQANGSKDYILKLAPAPTYLGLSTVFGDSVNRYSATALVRTTACFIDITTFKELIYANGKFAYQILADIARDELLIFNRYITQMHKRIPGRLAGVLIYFVEKVHHNLTFELPLTRSELAELMGVSRESAIRQLMLFKEDGMITIDKNRISILNLESLKKIYEAG